MVSRRPYSLYLTACVLFLSTVGSVSAKPFKWQEVKISGRRYIPANSIADFYKFDDKSIEGNVVRFVHHKSKPRDCNLSQLLLLS